MTANHQDVDFTIGEKPEALMWQYVDGDGNAIVLDAGAVVRLRMKRRNGTAREESGSIHDRDNGWVRYDWVGDELDTPGVLSCMFWTDSGGMRLASDEIDVRCWESTPGPRTAPLPT